MTEQEREMLNALLTNLVTTSVGQKDPEAEQLIRHALARQPDAAYLLIQRTLLQEIALKNAQSRINALEQQLRQAQSTSGRTSSSGSFLGSGWGQSAPSSGWSQSSPPPQDWNVQPAPSRMAQPSAFSGFLKSAATTAAGVAGGALLFEGLENLFDHHGGWQGQPQEIVENIIEPPPSATDYREVPQGNFPPDDSGQYIPDDFSQGNWDDNQGFDNGDNFYQT